MFLVNDGLFEHVLSSNGKKTSKYVKLKNINYHSELMGTCSFERAIVRKVKNIFPFLPKIIESLGQFHDQAPDPSFEIGFTIKGLIIRTMGSFLDHPIVEKDSSVGEVS